MQRASNDRIHAADGTARSIRMREFVVLMAALMSLNALAIDAMLPALDEIAETFAMTDPNRRQLIVGIYLLASGVGALIPGSLADRFGRRPVLFGCLTLYAIFSAACALATSYDVLLVMRFMQGFCTAGLMVLPAAIIRDRFEGDAMARLLSLIFLVFMIVPVLAPSLGQLVLQFAPWQAIFGLLTTLSCAVLAWAFIRLPETLDPAERQPIDARTVLHNLPLTLRTRVAVGYVFGGGLTFGAVFGYINSAQQLIGEHFGAGDAFPLIFGLTASTLFFSSFTNSRIVERFGARRVSHTALVLFVGFSIAQTTAAHFAPDNLWLFVPLIAGNLCLLGFTGSNFGSIAMQPFGHVAGAASSVQSFIRMTLGAGVGIAIGQFYDGSAMPLALALLLCSLAALLLVLFSERGKLFRRPGEARRYLAVHDVMKG
ncbi:multidrug effflux MFS transporter [Paraurantiacibacter namhicola]|uniref:Bcr/CflA family efflux transporter n=1 Tax=Paraurantiacibacter namhicola TaxID=645517 RepID=A0A1C7D6X6_9SPHN|nr:multidrug effflux MFS transporter [Paraurantiacibacter namhicola]ANU07236.1 Bicyclomycin resistance protein [Paraurantiacibacter namhicola]